MTRVLRPIVATAATIIVRVIAAVVPQASRPRWREEWLAEIAAVPRSWDVLRLGGGVLRDALSFHRIAPGEIIKGPSVADARQTIRSLARSPWHVVTVSLCLGIGIAVSVTVFSILSAILTGDLPGIRDRASVMRLYLTTDERWGPSSPGNASRSDYEILREGAPSLPAVAVEGMWDFAVGTPASGSFAVEGAFVSGNYFDVLGTTAALGRLLTPADDSPGAPPAAVISYAFWTANLGAPADIVGSTLRVGGLDVVVAGVAPEHFSGTDVGALGEPPGLRFRIYVPLSLAPTLARGVGADERWLTVIARAAAAGSRDVFAAELQPLASRIEGENPATRKNASILVQPTGTGPSDTPGFIAVIVALMMAAPLTVLAIGCANVANLQLVRASSRGRELAVRQAIGASRAQLVRLLTFESVMLAAIACAAGTFATFLLLHVAALVIPFHVAVDWRVLLFILAIAVLVVIATGVVPAWLATRSRQAMSLTAGGRAGVAGASRARRVLVVAQLAMCLLLLLTATTFTRSLDALAGRIPVVAYDVIVAELRFDTVRYSQPQRAAYVDALQARLRTDPRTNAVALSSVAPMQRAEWRFLLPGDAHDRVRSAGGGHVGAGWFDAAGLQILRGRAFVTDDIINRDTAVVDKTFVERFRLAEPVLGTQLRVVEEQGQQRTVTIVGVSSNPMSRAVMREPTPNLYLTLRNLPDYAALYVRSDHAGDLIPVVRQTMAAVDGDLPPVEISTLASRFHSDNGDIRLLARAAAGLGTAALMLALAGVYSVVAFFVSLRTREFGIRLAIGARPRDLTHMVVAQTLRLVGIGLVAGFVVSIPVLVGLRSAFPYMSAFDPVVLVGASTALALAAIAAAVVPASRAGRTPASVALRAE